MSDLVATAQSLKLRNAVSLIATLAGPLSVAWFGFLLWKTGESQNIATFTLWGTLDFIFCASLWKAGVKKDSMFAGAYGIAAFLVIAAIYHNGNWTLGFEEKICAIGTLLALFGWWKSGTKASVICGALTMEIAGIPVIVDAALHPAAWTLVLWLPCAITGWILFSLAPNWKLESWVFSGTSAVFNTVVSLLVAQALFI